MTRPTTRRPSTIRVTPADEAQPAAQNASSKPSARGARAPVMHAPRPGLDAGGTSSRPELGPELAHRLGLVRGEGRLGHVAEVELGQKLALADALVGESPERV